MATAQHLLDVARSQLGVHEDPPKSNSTPYGRWYGMDGQAWCAMFASWCLAQVGVHDWKHAYTPTGYQMFRNAGRLHFKGAQPGDLVYFDFPGDAVHRISHVGFVESVNPDGTVNTIEGNTNAAGSRTGGNVLRHRRDPIVHGIRGYGRPDYDPPEDDDMTDEERWVLADLWVRSCYERRAKTDPGFVVREEDVKYWIGRVVGRNTSFGGAAEAIAG